MSHSPSSRLPVKIERAQPPAPLWQQAAPVVVRGAALVAVGIIGEWVLRSATKKAVSMPFSGGKKSRALAKQEAASPEAVSYSETIIVQRTVTRSR